MSERELMAKVAEAVRRMRAARGLGVGEAAGLAGLSQAYWSQIEMGVRCPRLATLVAIASVLGCKVSGLLRGVC